MTTTHSVLQRRRLQSISFKINAAICVVFAVIVALLTAYSYFADRKANPDLAIAQEKGMNGFHFDSLNTLMLTDGIDDCESPRNKLRELPSVIDVRIGRGDAISKKYRNGLPGEQPVDELDHRGLAGESIVDVAEVDGERILTIIEPYRLTENTRGTDCLECHRRVQSGTVGGAVRLTYSMRETDDRALTGLWQKLAVIAALFLFGLGVLTVLSQRMVVQPVNGVVQRLRDIAAGEGDLTQTLPEGRHDELGALAHWFNVFVGQLRQTVDRITGHVTELSSAAERMRGTTQRTRDAVNEQRRETDQVAAAMTEMSATVEGVARSAGEAAQAASVSNAEAKVGRDVMQTTMRAINALSGEVDAAGNVIRDLEHEGENINVVLEVIRSIAEQTNLLALNAAIEAARAGEQGCGFAVVADEVRTLAERTQRSTQEIQRKIELLQQGTRGAVEVMMRSRQQADASVDLAAKADASLESISTSVATIMTMSQQIAAAAADHSKVSGEMSQNVVAINEAAIGAAGDTEQVAITSRELSEIAEQLRSLVGQFKTR